jgi:hypothetical protein
MSLVRVSVASILFLGWCVTADKVILLSASSTKCAACEIVAIRDPLHDNSERFTSNTGPVARQQRKIHQQER